MRSNYLLVAVAAMLLAGCTATKKTETNEPAIATIGSQPISISEFRYVYEKNNNGSEDAYSSQSVNDYLNLYTNFKLKVMEAESRGLDTTSAFRKELEGYKEQLALPYLTEKSVTDKLVQEAYERMKQEVNASHILITVSPEAEPQDTLEAYNKAIALRERALAGADFGKLARENSQDPSAADNNGNLGYFTAMQMVYPFEDAAYKTAPGQVSMPVRTRFGYHIIKVNNVRPAQGEIQVAHIMVRATPDMPKADSLAIKQRVDALYKRIQRNENWDKLAAEFSEDANTASNGGVLPWFGTGRMIPSFEDAAFALQKTGDIAPPVATPYGWHIIKLIDKRGLPPYEDMEQSLRNKVAKDSRSELNKTAFMKRIRVENNFTEVAAAKQTALAKADDNLLQAKWTFDKEDQSLNTTLFTINGKPYTISDFYAYVQTEQRPRATGSSAHYMNQLYDSFASKTLLDYEKANLENKHIDYRMLVKEYHDGILLFQLMDEKVWSKAVEDTVGLKAYFEQNKEKYKWGPRAQAIVVSAANKDLLNKAAQELEKKERRFPVTSNRQNDLLFAQNKTELRPESTTRLNALANQLSSNPSLSLEINGHADSREDAANKSLAQKRAQAAMDYLVSKGVEANQLSTKALGKSNQAGPDNTEAGRRRNRRVSLVLFSSDLNTLAETLNAGNPLAVQISEKKFQKGDNKALDAVKWEKGVHVTQQNGRDYLIIIDEILEPDYKELNEVRGIVTSDYQNHLEQQWVNELREKYPVSVNQEEVSRLIRN